MATRGNIRYTVKQLFIIITDNVGYALHLLLNNNYLHLFS